MTGNVIGSRSSLFCGSRDVGRTHHLLLNQFS